MSSKGRYAEGAEQERLRRECFLEIDYLAANWLQLSPLDRADRVGYILRYGLSKRKLAKLLGRSEALIRHYEIIASLNDNGRNLLLSGRYSARQLVAEIRRYQREQKHQQ
jgi:hypothetical protein